MKRKIVNYSNTELIKNVLEIMAKLKLHALKDTKKCIFECNGLDDSPFFSTPRIAVEREAISIYFECILKFKHQSVFKASSNHLQSSVHSVSYQLKQQKNNI